MSFEDRVSGLNEQFFFKEFTYSKNTFRPSPKGELELADSLVWLDDRLLVFQIKERDAPRDTTDVDEERWFNSKVLGKATKQIRDSLKYLSEFDRISLSNHRGHQFDLVQAREATIQKMVLYRGHPDLPLHCRMAKFHNSSTVGPIHLISSEDYLGICHTLVTPAEVFEYLDHREQLARSWSSDIDTVSEKGLVGHFLFGDISRRPQSQDEELVDRLEENRAEWDMGAVIRSLQEHIVISETPKDYYPIIMEIAKLNRATLRAFKDRFIRSIEKARENVFDSPYRFSDEKCGFVFAPMTMDLFDQRWTALRNFTMAHKYEQHLGRCIGISFISVGQGQTEIDYCFLDSTWEHNQKIEELLSCNNPFRDVKAQRVPRYKFKRCE